MLLHFEGDFNLQQHCFLRTQDICVNFTRVFFPIFTRSSVSHYKKISAGSEYIRLPNRESVFFKVFSAENVPALNRFLY